MHRRALLLSLLLASSACVRNPVSGHRQLSLMSQKDEIAQGQQAAKEVQQTVGVVNNPALNQYVSTVGLSMARHSERPDLPWSFQVADDATVNAFALPGGPIFATRGLLATLNTEAELAGVLGHEIGHVTARHSAAQVTRTELAQLGLGLGAVLSPTVAQYGQVAAAGMQLLFLRYSRGDESQADELGFRYMRQAGYDPRQMADVFATLQRVSEASGEGKLPTWLSTHPDPGDRLEKARQRIAELKGVDFSKLKVDETGYLNHLQGLVYGENPRQGFFRGNLFLHPDLRFQVQFPEGWKTQNQPQQVAAESPQQDAVVGLSPAPGVTPEQGLQKFLSQQGLRALPESTSGVPGSAGYFEAQTQQGVAVRGLTTFLSHGGSTFQLVGYTVADKLPTYDGVFRATFASFHELTDPAALAVQPAHLELVTLEQPLTVEQFQARYPSTVPLKELALINGVEVGATFPAGKRVKRVVGGPGPTGAAPKP